MPKQQPIEDHIADVMAECFPHKSIGAVLLMPTLSMALAVEVGLRAGKLNRYVADQVTRRLREIDAVLGVPGNLALGEILARGLAASDDVDDDDLAGLVGEDKVIDDGEDE